MEVDVNLTKIWNSTLGTMQVQTSRHEFNTWLRRATLLGIENGTATIGTPSAFFKEGLENRYIGPLRELISNLAGFPDRKSTRLNSSHSSISYAVFCLKKKTD